MKQDNAQKFAIFQRGKWPDADKGRNQFVRKMSLNQV